MKHTIAKTMNELRTDHRNMVMLLDLLDAESARFAANDEADYDLVYEIMTYMAEYPDTVHHPKEDLIYRHIQSHHPDIDDALQRIEADHKGLREASDEIRRDIDSIANDESVDLTALAESLRKYSKDLRMHMYWEERELFELADSMEDDREWADLLKSYADAHDPLFGSQVERRYKKLFNSIQQRIVWNSQQYFV